MSGDIPERGLRRCAFFAVAILLVALDDIRTGLRDAWRTWF